MACPILEKLSCSRSWVLGGGGGVGAAVGKCTAVVPWILQLFNHKQFSVVAAFGHFPTTDMVSFVDLVQVYSCHP